MHDGHQTRLLYSPVVPLAGSASEVLRYKHYSLRTAEAKQFLTMLTTQRNVSVSTHNRARFTVQFMCNQAKKITRNPKRIQKVENRTDQKNS